MEFYGRDQRRSRKCHTCHMCDKGILPGTEYINEKFKEKSLKPVELKRHIHCDAILRVYLDEYATDDRYDEQEVISWLMEEYCFGEICSDEQYDQCDEDGFTDIFECELIQRAILDPNTLRAAMNSVREGACK